MEKNILRLCCIYFSLVMGIAFASSCTTLLQTKDDLHMKDKTLLISIDDGLSETQGVDDKILDILSKYNIKASFCVIGYKVGLNDTALKRMVLQGHTIVWHSQWHEFYLGKRYQEVVNEIKEFEKKVSQTSGTDYRVRYIRPPNGILDSELARKLTDSGYILLGASHYPTDPFYNAKESVNYMDQTTEYFIKNRGGMLVLHNGSELIPRPGEADFKNVNSAANRSWVPVELERFILRMKAQGFDFIAIDDISW